MVKDKYISLRIRSNQYDKCKKYGWKFIDCFELGFQKKEEKILSELEKKIENVYTEYIRLKKEKEIFGTKQDNEIKELDNLRDWWELQNRSIDNPSSKDIETLKFQLNKRKIETITVEQVLNYLRDGK